MPAFAQLARSGPCRVLHNTGNFCAVRGTGPVGFSAPTPSKPVPEELLPFLDECLPLYRRLDYAFLFFLFSLSINCCQTTSMGFRRFWESERAPSFYAVGQHFPPCQQQSGYTRLFS